MTPALTAQGLTRDFRGFRAVDGVDLEVAQGDVHALVGPNGAGKTTLFNLLTGFLRPTAGRVNMAGTDITGYPPERSARLGLARSFQITSLFANLTALEHVELALLPHNQSWQFWRSDRLLRRQSHRAQELLERAGLAAFAHTKADALSYGRKRALELALALALDPKVLLLDEPTAGMGTEDIDRTIELIQSIRSGRTIVFVEHNMNVVGSLADRVTVLQSGRVLAEGTYEQMRSDERVVTAYLGTADVAH